MRDPRLDSGLVPDDERDKRARSWGARLAGEAPDLDRMRQAIDKGAFYSTTAFVAGFSEGLRGDHWHTWLEQGLSEDGLVSRAYGLNRFATEDLPAWRVRRSQEPWRVFEVHTGLFGRPFFVPALLLARSSRAHWRRCLDTISIPEVLLWLSASGDTDLERADHLAELCDAPAFLQGNRPTGQLRALASVRLYVEHCEDLEEAISVQDEGERDPFHLTELPDLARQLCTAISAREDREPMLGHTAEYLASKVLRGPRKRLAPEVLLEAIAAELRKLENPTRVLKAVDGRRRRGFRTWRDRKPPTPERVHSQQPEPEPPQGEGASNLDEIDGLPVWLALAHTHDSADSGAAQRELVWRLFVDLLAKRDCGFQRLEPWAGARPRFVRAASSALAMHPAPVTAWMNAYVETEPHRRRAGHFHRYVDIGVGVTTSILIQIGTAAAILLGDCQLRADLYAEVERAARRAWLVRIGGYGVDWEDLYAHVLAHSLVVDDGKSSRILGLLKTGSNSPHLLCSTAEYCLRVGCSTEFLAELERGLGIVLSDLTDDPILRSSGLQDYPTLRQALNAGAEQARPKGNK